MAGTDNGDVWLLLRAARDLVVSHGGVSIPTAERLIIERACSGHFTTCRFEGSYIPLAHWGHADPLTGLSVQVDFDNSVVRQLRTEPISDRQMWEVERLLKDFVSPGLPCPEMLLVRLAKHEVLAMLDKAGLAKPPEPPEVTPVPAPSEPATAAAPPGDDWTAEIIARHPELRTPMTADPWASQAAALMSRPKGQTHKVYKSL
jgi:hypothetical protein